MTTALLLILSAIGFGAGMLGGAMWERWVNKP